LILLWGGILLVNDLLSPLVLFLQSCLSDKAVYAVNRNIMEKSSRLHTLYRFEEKEFYDEIQVLQSGSHNRPINLVVTTVGLAKDVALTISCAALLSNFLGWLLLLILATSYINFRIYAKIQQEMWQESLGRSMDARKMHYLVSLTINKINAQEIRFFNLIDYIAKEYKRIFAVLYQRIFKLRLGLLLKPVIPILALTIINIWAFYIVASSVANTENSVGHMVIFLQGIAQLHFAVTSFSGQAGWLSGHLLFFEKYFKFLEYEEEAKETAPKVQINLKENLLIEFKKVSFVYPNGKKALENISFTLSTGEKIALVGANGAGKSSIIKLLSGHYFPTQGEVLINGHSIRDIDLPYYRAQIGPAFQDFGSYLLNLRQNVIMGESNNDEKYVVQAFKKVGLEEVLHAHGLDIQLGRQFGGIELSGGQWQKLALARALYKDSSLMILDEPTASLDPLSEKEIYKQFAATATEKTMIFVTHRLNSITLADKILLFDEGTLLHEGSHKTLYKNSPLYKEMFDAQAEAFLALTTR
jgi:ATP-binding cassette subfamily B protein